MVLLPLLLPDTGRMANGGTDLVEVACTAVVSGEYKNAHPSQPLPEDPRGQQQGQLGETAVSATVPAVRVLRWLPQSDHLRQLPQRETLVKPLSARE